MKSIGLYGDSFAGNPDESSFRNHWSQKLKKHLGCGLVNYGWAGSSIYFSYTNFLENYKDHDLNIFLITDPNRYFQKIRGAVVPNVASLERCDVLTSEEKKLLAGWFFFSDHDHNIAMKDLMIGKILQLDPSVLLIPCFTWVAGKEIDIALDTLQQYQISRFNKDPKVIIQNYSENPSIISGHLLPELHEFIFNVIKYKLESGIWDWTGYENVKFKYKFSDLYKKNI